MSNTDGQLLVVNTHLHTDDHCRFTLGTSAFGHLVSNSTSDFDVAAALAKLDLIFLHFILGSSTSKVIPLVEGTNHVLLVSQDDFITWTTVKVIYAMLSTFFTKWLFVMPSRVYHKIWRLSLFSWKILCLWMTLQSLIAHAWIHILMLLLPPTECCFSLRYFYVFIYFVTFYSLYSFYFRNMRSNRMGKF